MKGIPLVPAAASRHHPDRPSDLLSQELRTSLEWQGQETEVYFCRPPAKLERAGQRVIDHLQHLQVVGHEIR